MSVWFKEKRPRRKPWWASDAMWQEMTGVFLVQLLGTTYEFPINARTRPFVALIKGANDPWAWLKGRRSEFRRASLAEDGIQDIVNALLIQVRETGVAEAAQLLGQEINEKLRPLLQQKIRQNLEGATRALPVNHRPAKE